MDNNQNQQEKEDTETATEEEEDEELTLESLPVELLLHISTFLSTQTLLTTLSLTNKYFHGIFADEKTWEIRQKKLFGGGTFPPVDAQPQNLPPLLFRQASLKREQTLQLFSPAPRKLTLPHHQIACVDSILLLGKNKLLLSGSRDRSLCLTSLEDVENPVLLDKKENAHNGWIWDFASLHNHNGDGGDQFVSVGWDNFIKLWDLETITTTSQVKTTSACLCISHCAKSNLLAAGNFDKTISLVDSRSMCITKTYKTHRNCVLSIGIENNEVISGGEDGRLVLYDVRGGRVRSVVQIPCSSDSGVKNYPKCISYAKTGNYPLKSFYVGDIRGGLHLIENNEKRFGIVRSYDICGTGGGKVQGVFHTLGGVLTCSSNGELAVFQPTLELKKISSVSVGEKVELPKVHALNSRVALAGGDGLIRIYY